MVRSGRVEAVHTGSVAAVDAAGEVLAGWGDLDRRFFLRSTAKPFQAAVSQAAGAGLEAQQLALACASHAGQPVHVAIVRSILAEGSLEESALACPPAWPYAEEARARLLAAGHRTPRRVWHNCSGKHAAMLRACLARGWPTSSYTDPDHPLQGRVASLLAELTGEDPGPPGVDGCGVPVFSTSVVGLARAYARLAVDPSLGEVASAMHRYPALTADGASLATALATSVHAASKGGAEACLGVALLGRVGVGAKCWDGSWRGLEVGMLEALRQLGVFAGPVPERLRSWAEPPVLGGGRPVGRLRSALGEPTMSRSS